MRFSDHEDNSLSLGGPLPDPGSLSFDIPRPRRAPPVEPEVERFGILRAVLKSCSLPDPPVIGFAGCSGGGAGSVLRAFGRELAAEGKRVAVADLAKMQNVTREQLEAFDPELLPLEDDGCWHWQPIAPVRGGKKPTIQVPASADPRIWSVELLRSSFDCTLLEAPALDTGLKPVLLAALADAVFLVVEAGKCRTSQVERARKTLELVNANLIGCVLTGRRYPVPGWIYRML